MLNVKMVTLNVWLGKILILELLMLKRPNPLKFKYWRAVGANCLGSLFSFSFEGIEVFTKNMLGCIIKFCLEKCNLELWPFKKCSSEGDLLYLNLPPNTISRPSCWTMNKIATCISASLRVSLVAEQSKSSILTLFCTGTFCVSVVTS